MTREPLTAPTESDAAAALAKNRQTDGLPIVVPTPERVEEMLLYAMGLPRDASLGHLLPRNGNLTIEKAAINAVMAGCAAETFPLVIAACEAICDPAFDAGPLQNTTHPVTPLIIVNGPARELYGVSSGGGAMGPGWPVNLTLGRAIRLILINVGGGIPGVGDMASLGSPSKLALCLAEGEEDSPFEPLHVSLGFDASDSVVTVLAVEGPHTMMFNLDEIENQADLFLRTLAAGFANPATNNIYTGVGAVAAVLNPLHAKILQRAGMTRRDVQHKLFAYARSTRSALKAISGANINTIPHSDEVVTVVQRPEDFLIFVSGSDGGGYSAYFPTWSGGKQGNIPISRKVRFVDGCEMPRSIRD
jgi:hypothetical protein